MARTKIIPTLRDFSGGLNLRDAQTELGPTDLSQALNVTLDERGGLNGRLGAVKYNDTVFGGGAVTNVFYWQTGGNVITQAGASLYKDTGLVAFKTFTTPARCGMCDFAGKLCIVHPVDGMFTYDGAAVVAVAAGPKADVIVPWQNKLWANDKGGTNPKSQVNFSAIGDPTTWPGTNAIREVDDAQVVALFSGQSQDVKGLAGLLVCKQRSSYRINDSATGAYTTLSPVIGANSALCITAAAAGRVFLLSAAGVFQTDGVSVPVKISGKLDPLFGNGLNSTGVQFQRLCAGATFDRVYFSIPIASGGGSNDRMLEYHPEQGWFTMNSNPAASYAFTGTQLLTGHPVTSGQVNVQLSGGLSEEGLSIAAVAQTRFVELNAGMRARLNQVRVNGRGAFTLSPLYDYDWTHPVSRAIAIAVSSGTVHGGYQDVYNLGSAKAFAFRVDATTSTTGTIPFGTGNLSDVHTVGGWGLYGLDLSAVPLGRT